MTTITDIDWPIAQVPHCDECNESAKYRIRWTGGVVSFLCREHATQAVREVAGRKIGGEGFGIRAKSGVRLRRIEEAQRTIFEIEP